MLRSIDEPGLVAPIILAIRKGERSPLLIHMKAVIRGFDGSEERGV